MLGIRECTYNKWPWEENQSSRTLAWNHTLKMHSACVENHLLSWPRQIIIVKLLEFKGKEKKSFESRQKDQVTFKGRKVRLSWYLFLRPTLYAKWKWSNILRNLGKENMCQRFSQPDFVYKGHKLLRNYFYLKFTKHTIK